ncbi:MAG: alpha/beta hydrolase [Parachlamydiales bacterium]
MRCKTALLPWGTTLYYTGPDLSEGALPAFFYFSLAGDESLCEDPFNQPAVALSDLPIRTFSLTLPGHGPDFDRQKAIAYWAKETGAGNRPIETFIQEASKAVDYLLDSGIATKVGAGGLSRGAFIATHLAAKNPRIVATVGFAPLTDLSYAHDFASIKEHPAVTSLALKRQIPHLIGRPLRFYIGNRDLLVGTENACHFILALADATYKRHIRHLDAELIIGPSIGAKGHGTAKETFEAGAMWLWKELSP